ncbi:MAG: lysylphosphatidylglycerol synthase domain-containing protein [Novosphingobium sp.]
MSGAQSKSGWGGALLGLVLVVVLVSLVLASANLRELLIKAMAQVTLRSVLATFPGQAGSMLLCAGALWALRPGVGYLACLGSRVLRDASGNLPVSVPGFSAAIGARALVLAGGETRAAISASALDKVAETVAQFPFIALAVWVMWHKWPPLLILPVGLPQHSGLLALAGAGGLLLGVVLWRKFGAGSQLVTRLTSEAHRLLAEARHQHGGMPTSLLLHVVGWLAGGVQLWMAALALGYDLTLYESIAVESSAYAGRAMFFFIPAGLVTQEAGLVAAGLLFGLSAPQALALGLILRLRDALMALGLLAWPFLEWRRRRA